MVPNVPPAICDGQTVEAGNDWLPELHLMKMHIFFEAQICFLVALKNALDVSHLLCKMW